MKANSGSASRQPDLLPGPCARPSPSRRTTGWSTLPTPWTGQKWRNEPSRFDPPSSRTPLGDRHTCVPCWGPQCLWPPESSPTGRRRTALIGDQRTPFARCRPHQRSPDSTKLRTVGIAINMVEPDRSFIIQEYSNPKPAKRVTKALAVTKMPCFSGLPTTIRAPMPTAKITPPGHRSQPNSTGLAPDRVTRMPGTIKKPSP